MRAFLRNMIEPKRNSVASFAPRSVLFVPLHNKRALAKAPALNADAFILDLEDAVPTHAKVAARENIAEAVKQLQGRRLTIRINCPLRSPALAEEDMNAVAEVSRSLSAIVLPKVEGVANVEVIKQQLYPDLEVWANIETPKGVLAAMEIAESQLYSTLVAGTNDLAAELQLPETAKDRWNLVPHLSSIVIAARAYGVSVIDGVYNDIRNSEGFEKEAGQGRMLGFDGKCCVHPTQVELANRIFTPSESDVRRAKAVIEAVDNAGGGVALLDGCIVEDLHMRSAQRVLMRAGIPLSSDSQQQPQESAKP